MSGIEAWSTTAASNNASPPDGAPEGMAAGTVNNTIRQLMASVRTWYEDAQWVNLGLTPTRVDADTFSLVGDVTATFHVGRRVKVTGSATGYATIAASAYSAPNTNVDVTMDSGSLPVTLSAVYISVLSATNPSVPNQANPSWTNATGGTLTLSTPLGVASGGTGSATVAGARSSLGVSATGSDTTYSFRANNLSDLASAATARSNLGLVIGTDVPSATGTGASGSWAINISGNATTATTATTATNVTGPVAVANGGTSATTAASARSNLGLAVGSDVPSVSGTGASGTWPINITGNAVTATSATSASSASTATNVTGTVAVANGGTGSTTASTARSALGLVAVASSGSAADLSTGTLSDSRVASSNVTQYQTSLTIAETQITDGALLARVGGNETISGTWAFSNSLGLTGGVTNSGKDILSGGISPSLTGNVGDWSPGISGVNYIRVSGNTPGWNISGLAGGTAGQFIFMWNVGSNSINLLSEDAGATAANRFTTQSAATKTMNAGCGAFLFYDGNTSRWRVGLLV